MEIKLDPNSIATVASAAIFDQMSQEARDSVIKQAVQSLLTPEKDRYSSMGGKTPLQQAFEAAIRQAAFEAVREKVQNDPAVREGINKLLGPLLNAALDSEAKEYSTSLSEALGSALGSWLADKARGDS